MFHRITLLAVLASPLACSTSASSAAPQEAPTPAPMAKAAPHKPGPAAKRKKTRKPNRKSYATELRLLDEDREGFETLSTAHPSVRGHHERIASAFIQRARLSGNYDDYAKAEARLAQAMERRPSAGTKMLRAKLHYTLHRLPQARADFAEAAPRLDNSPDSVASREAFAANLALQAGDDKTAAAHFEASLAAKRTMGNLASAAVFHWKTGDFEGAESLFREALKAYHGKRMEPRAWLHLNLGLLDLDRGRLDDALAHYRDAASFLEGYWLIDEHIAEILTLQGKTDDAKALYLDIIERTHNPEFMDAMAGIAFEAGEDDEGKAWVAKARARYEAQMAQFPEAAYGHALGHYLEFGDDPAATLELARENHALRPNLEASVMLAQAQLKVGDADAARDALSPMLASSFESAELYITAAQVHAALGQDAKARAYETQAQAIDPTSRL